MVEVFLVTCELWPLLLLSFLESSTPGLMNLVTVIDSYMNLGLVTAKWCAQDRSAWRKLVTTATSSQTHSWRRIDSCSNFIICTCFVADCLWVTVMSCLLGSLQVYKYHQQLAAIHRVSISIDVIDFDSILYFCDQNVMLHKSCLR